MVEGLALGRRNPISASRAQKERRATSHPLVTEIRLKVKSRQPAETLPAHNRRRDILARALQPAFDRKLKHLRAEQAEVEMIDEPIQHESHTPITDDEALELHGRAANFRGNFVERRARA